MDTQDTPGVPGGESTRPGSMGPYTLSDLLFERMPMGIAILDRELRIQRFNPTWGEFAARYAPRSGARLAPGVAYFDHLPGTEDVVLPLFERALAGEVVREESVRLESDGIVTYWDVVLAPLNEYGERAGILNVAVDVTERVELQRNLEQRVGERTQELQLLLDVSAAAHKSLDLRETLERTLDLVVGLVGATRAGVVLLDPETGQLDPHTLRPPQVVAPDDLAKILGACASVVAGGENLVVTPDPDQGLHEPGALLLLQARGIFIGVLIIIGATGSVFTPAQLALFQSIAEQLSVAVENARLFATAEQVAVTAERNRLARDLHDAVTQTLFSAGMIAEVLPMIWEREPAEGRRRLQELRRLTRGALSEMRTLLLELRPAALADSDLGDLIGHQVNAFVARTGLPVAYEREGQVAPPLEVKEGLYRIAQEAFNNIGKHAAATRVTVRLRGAPGRAELFIHDDGVGFEPRAPHRQGLGLGIMRERATGIGAALAIQSRPGTGTRLSVAWHSPGEEHEDE